MCSQAGSAGVSVSLLRAPKLGGPDPAAGPGSALACAFWPLAHLSHVSGFGVGGSPLSSVRLSGRQTACPCGNVSIPLPGIPHHPRQNGMYAAGTGGVRGAQSPPEEVGQLGGSLLRQLRRNRSAPGAALWVGAGLLWGRSGLQVLLLVSLVPPSCAQRKLSWKGPQFLSCSPQVAGAVGHPWTPVCPAMLGQAHHPQSGPWLRLARTLHFSPSCFLTSGYSCCFFLRCVSPWSAEGLELAG